MPLRYIPEGSFWMGSDAGETGSQPDERPLRREELGDYWIDEREVSWKQYLACVEEDGCGPSRVEPPSVSRRDLPVVGVTWEDAAAYCTWAGRQLPTEAQWEKAARGSDGRPYPWGWIGAPIIGRSARANFCDRSCDLEYRFVSIDDGYAQAAPVGSFEDGASPYGVLDMTGNVWEWTSGLYNGVGDSTDAEETMDKEGARVIRGGSWLEPAWRGWVLSSRAANRGWLPPERSRIDLGFRCALDSTADER